MFWTVASDCPVKNLIDPRIAIASQIKWQKYTTADTDFVTPEPDNFNWATFSSKPLECPDVQNQVIYRDSFRGAWVSVFYVRPEEQPAFDSWLKNQTIWAYWQHTSPPPIRPQRLLLRTRRRDNYKELTTNERLYTMGYYERLKTVLKYDCDITKIVESRLGEARASLKHLTLYELDDATIEE